MEKVKKEKKSYSEPRLEKIARIQELTKGAGGNNEDGNGTGDFGVPPSQL